MDSIVIARYALPLTVCTIMIGLVSVDEKYIVFLLSLLISKIFCNNTEIQKISRFGRCQDIYCVTREFCVQRVLTAVPSCGFQGNRGDILSVIVRKQLVQFA